MNEDPTTPRAADIGVHRALVMVPDGAPEKETLELLDRYTGLLPGWRGTASVETELVALDVLHHDARLVVVVGSQQSYADLRRR